MGHPATAAGFVSFQGFFPLVSDLLARFPAKIDVCGYCWRCRWDGHCTLSCVPVPDVGLKVTANRAVRFGIKLAPQRPVAEPAKWLSS